jgi:hypothetical protein
VRLPTVAGNRVKSFLQMTDIAGLVKVLPGH